MTTVYYKFPALAGKNVRIQTGYVGLEIKNGYAKVDADNEAQEALAKAHGGELDKDIPAKKSSKKQVKR